MTQRSAALAASILLAALAPAAVQAKSTVAVAPFTFHRNVQAVPGAELQTATLTQKFVTELVKTNKFDVVERARVDELLDEIAFSDAGFTDPTRAVKAGQMLGADYFLMGEVSVFTLGTQVRPVPHTQRFFRNAELRLICDMRIVDARTSKIVSAEKGDVSMKWKRMFRSRPAPHEPVEPAKLDEVQRQVVAQLVRKVIDTVYPLKVIAVNAMGVASVNRGESAGIQQGEVYDCFSMGEAMVDPDTGEVLGTEETKVGRIRITQVLPKFSKAEVVAGSPQKGNICRPASGSADFAPPPPPPPPADTQAPRITILAPREGQTISSAPITVAAEVRDDVGVSRVRINGADAAQDAKGRYMVRIGKPQDGRNGVRVEAWDAAGNRAVAECTFLFDSTPPEVEAEATILVEGKVDDLSCTLTVNGLRVEYDRSTGRYSVRVPPHPEHPDKVVIVATDEFGNQNTEIRNIR